MSNKQRLKAIKEYRKLLELNYANLTTRGSEIFNNYTKNLINDKLSALIAITL